MIKRYFIPKKHSRFDLPKQYLTSLRSYDPNSRYSKLKGPLFVQIQTVDSCNASCLMCPYSIQKRKEQTNHMDDMLYTKILTDLKKTGTVKVFSPMLQSEPLLDPHIVNRIRQAKNILGQDVVVGIVTNGSLLTPKLTQSLVEAGIDRIEISIDAVDIATFKNVRPGISFSKVIDNTEKILALHSNVQVVVRFLIHAENMGQESEFKRYWRARGADVLFTPVVNRAGFVTDFEKFKRSYSMFSFKHLKKGLWRLSVRFYLGIREPVLCVLPFSWLYILLDGRVVLCCHDWGPLDTVGNLQTQTVEQVWNGEKMNKYRHILWTGKYADSPVCRDCSVVNGM